MKIKDGFILRQMNSMNIVVAVGDRAAEFNGLITLNETGMFLWNKLVNDIDEQGLVDAVLREYNGVSEDKAREDVVKFTEKLRQADILDE